MRAMRLPQFTRGFLADEHCSSKKSHPVCRKTSSQRLPGWPRTHKIGEELKNARCRKTFGICAQVTGRVSIPDLARSIVQGQALADEPGLGTLTLPGFLREVTARFAEREA